jgi:hypothetical protein
MDFDAPKIKKFNWSALLMQSFVLQFYIFLPTFFFDSFSISFGVIAYVIHWYFLKRILIPDYFKGKKLQNEKAFLLSNRHFEKAYKELLIKPHLDQHRTMLFLSSSSSSYTERCLYEMAENYLQSRDFIKGEEYLKRLNEEFPANRLSAAGLSMLRYVKEVESGLIEAQAIAAKKIEEAKSEEG